jgi:choline dehydrogenase-like flavoprotein
MSASSLHAPGGRISLRRDTNVLIDARELPVGATVRTRVCVVGAGPAGLTVADELTQSGLDVCVLEAGSEKEDRTIRRSYNGENGDPFYYRLDRTRAWGFGGSSQRWHSKGVRLHPMQPIDFEARAEIPHSGWPFTRENLAPFYHRAQEVCRAGPFDYEPRAWMCDADDRPLRLPSELVETIVFQLAPRARFDDRLHEFARAADPRVILRANAVELVTDDAGGRVVGVRGASLPGREFFVQADVYVLACGGIENARRLLLSRSTHADGLGNANDLVGRFFMEHPHFRTGTVRLHEPVPGKTLSLYTVRPRNGFNVEGTLRPSPRAVRSAGLLNSSWWIFPRVEEAVAGEVGSALMSLRELREYGRITPGTGRRVLQVARQPTTALRTVAAAWKKTKDQPVTTFQLAVTSEQAPNPASRVRLGTRRDPFDQPKARLAWRLSSLDLDSIERTQELLGRAFAKARVGTLTGGLGEVDVLPNVGGGAHHMGSTRMHSSPRQGVVDADCKVHGVQNLFVSGSSVFPTGGYANPQLTLLALALRLADHLKARLAP